MYSNACALETTSMKLYGDVDLFAKAPLCPDPVWKLLLSLLVVVLRPVWASGRRAPF